jgi:DNA-binding response OmpR family regulator
VAVADGREASIALSKCSFCLVVTDLVMPNVDGQELIANVRQSSNIPIVMLTATDETDIPAETLALVDVYLQKPCPAEDLVAGSSFCRRPQDQLAETLTRGRTIRRLRHE